MSAQPTPGACSNLLLFGATGDLARRMLLPSLYNLDVDGLLPKGLRIVGSARSDLDDAAWREMARESLKATLAAERLSRERLEPFLERLAYRTLDVTQPGGFAGLAEALCARGGEAAPLAIFLSTAADLFEPTIAGLRQAGLTGRNARIGLEKPLGHDLASSAEINDAVAAAFPEERIFRFDHYLGKETVQNLLALRFGNSLFEPLWNSRGIDHVQITIAETVGLENRGGFYDAAGALRDMVQNHVLQLLCHVAMEPPAAFDGTAVRDEKVKVLRCLRMIDAAAARADTVTGQYGAGEVGGEAVKAYADDLGKPSDTETFVAIRAHVDNWRWQGVPFYLRTGKRLAVRRSQILVRFKPVPHSMFAGDGPGAALQPNTLLIRLQPEENIALSVMAKTPGLDRDGVSLREVALDLSLASAFGGLRRRIAYERLLLDLIEGRPMLFVRRDEVEAQWRWIDGIRAAWREIGREPEPYPAGSWGPKGAAELAERGGITWHE